MSPTTPLRARAASKASLSAHKTAATAVKKVTKGTAVKVEKTKTTAVKTPARNTAARNVAITEESEDSSSDDDDIPAVAVRKAAVPKIAAPKAAVPKVAVPKVAAPKAAVSKVAVPKVAAPKAAVSKVAVPKVAVRKGVAQRVVANTTVANPLTTTAGFRHNHAPNSLVSRWGRPVKYTPTEQPGTVRVGEVTYKAKHRFYRGNPPASISAREWDLVYNRADSNAGKDYAGAKEYRLKLRQNGMTRDVAIDYLVKKKDLRKSFRDINP
ncbi:uncharacterized protein RAG0_15164 [Rhynchosporium agropyri]|uniref:Uncharacterized protein n=1 Tax=Rhynchosporium agropyri TaxID=914238 RepID=A0A1E1LJY4_9HELO|nr:uncharacterized protein RAG0_15164 [Rhynchosporium agropyri]